MTHEQIQPPDDFLKLTPLNRFLAIKNYPDLLHGGQCVDRIPPVVKKDADCSELLNSAVATWKDAFQQEPFLTEIRSVAESGESAQPTYLKKIRLAGLVAASGFRLFDAKHWSPEEFHTLINRLGSLNDCLRGTSAGEARAVAGEIIRHLTQTGDLAEKIRSLMCPASVQSHYAYVRSVCTDSLRIVDQPFMTVEELHWTRKQGMRDLLHLILVELMRRGISDEPFIRIYQDIVKAYGQLDCERKKAVRLEREGSEVQQISLPDDVRDRARSVLQTFLSAYADMPDASM